jgi:hypothetical protein
MPSLYQLFSCSRSHFLTDMATKGMHALVSRWHKAVDVDGDYVEK